MLKITRTSRATVIADLRAAAALGDLPKLNALAHSTKGMASEFFATALIDSARALETAAGSNSPEAPILAEPLARFLEEFLSELDRRQMPTASS